MSNQPPDHIPRVDWIYGIRTYRVNWINGTFSLLEGETLHDALRSAGYGFPCDPDKLIESVEEVEE